MPRNILIPIENGRAAKTYGVNYNEIYIMKRISIFFAIILVGASCVSCDLEFYPGFRRPNPITKWDKEQAEEYVIEQVSNFLREQQRRMLERQYEDEAFSNRFFEERKLEDFAIAPPDPRYYEPIIEDFYRDREEYPTQVEEEEPLPEEPQIVETPVIKVRSEEPSPPEAPVTPVREQTVGRLVSIAGERPASEAVYVKPVLQDDTAGVYVIAVVAGISAAATVGLIAFGIGWYNLQKNVKNASDVEYPAYGVTGPNKDVSPTGDRRLAQSAQMYHYQHQKQQIIAMERTAASDRHGSLSEAESDEENEEGDYTVYECPGLAPTGEMEVKNPLFQDDTTPAAVQAAPKDQQQNNQK